MHATPNPKNTGRWSDIFILLAFLGGIFFIFLGKRWLHVPDEGRYAEIAREMVANRDYLTPYLNNIQYFEKPPLFYWLEALALHWAGLNIFALRTINALCAILGCLITYCYAMRFYGRTAGLLAAFILATSPLYFGMAHIINLDMSMTLFLMLTLVSFVFAIQYPVGSQRRWWMWLSYSAAALATMTKGLIGIVFPSMIIGCWIVVMNEWRLLTKLYLPSGMLIFLAIAAPWHLLMQINHPAFFDFYFIQQQVARYATQTIGHIEPIGFYIPILFVGFFPWIVFLPQALLQSRCSWRRRHLYRHEIFLCLWFMVVFIFFSFSQSKLIPYILTGIPPLAILIARYFTSLDKQHNRGYIRGFAVIPLLSIGLFFGLFFLIDFSLTLHPTYAKYLLCLAFGFLVMGTTGAFCFRHQLLKAVSLIITMSTFLVTMLATVSYVDENSIYPLAKILQPILKKEDEVISFKQYYQDLPFYLERRITVLDWRNELRFGMQFQDTSAWMIDETVFWQRWHSHRRIFAMMRRKEYVRALQNYPYEKFYLIAETKKNVLVSNHLS